jgi:hypothetical protein
MSIEEEIKKLEKAIKELAKTFGFEVEVKHINWDELDIDAKLMHLNNMLEVNPALALEIVDRELKKDYEKDVLDALIDIKIRGLTNLGRFDDAEDIVKSHYKDDEIEKYLILGLINFFKFGATFNYSTLLKSKEYYEKIIDNVVDISVYMSYANILYLLGDSRFAKYYITANDIDSSYTKHFLNNLWIFDDMLAFMAFFQFLNYLGEAEDDRALELLNNMLKFINNRDWTKHISRFKGFILFLKNPTLSYETLKDDVELINLIQTSTSVEFILRSLYANDSSDFGFLMRIFLEIDNNESIEERLDKRRTKKLLLFKKFSKRSKLKRVLSQYPVGILREIADNLAIDKNLKKDELIANIMNALNFSGRRMVMMLDKEKRLLMDEVIKNSHINYFTALKKYGWNNIEYLLNRGLIYLGTINKEPVLFIPEDLKNSLVID